MRNYIIKRLLLFVPTVIFVSMLIFFILRVVPGDISVIVLQAGDRETPVSESDRRELVQMLGLDKPIYAQYLDWAWQLVRFDLGTSWIRKRPIATDLKAQIPVTLQLALLSTTIVVLVALPIGVLAAVYQDKWPDYILRTIAIVALAMPGFFVGLMIILILSVYFGWLPPAGFTNLWDNPWDSFRQLIFPAVALSFSSGGYILRMTRAQMLEVLREDYIRTARAKGLVEQVVVMRHALRNALLPVVTLFGFQIIFMVGGSVIMEQIFNIPGVGKALVDAVSYRDLPVVQARVLYVAVIALGVNLLVDLTYAWLDPRIQYT